MYRSIEHQLRVTRAGGGGGGEQDDSEGGEGDGEGGDGGAAVPDYQELRELAADHIRAHRDEFAPYLVPEDDAEDAAAYFERYCDDVEATATWGGHVELQALASALKRRIVVYGVGMQPQTLGEGFEGPPLTLCFLQHALGLGSHYNSTRPLLFAAAGAGGEEEEKEDAAAEEEDDE